MKMKLTTILLTAFAIFTVNCGGTAEKNETKSAPTVPAVTASPANTNPTVKPNDADDVKSVNKPLKQDSDDVRKSSTNSNSANKRSDRDADVQNKNIRREDREKRVRNDDDDDK